MSRLQKVLSRFRFGPYEWAALAIITFSFILRMVLVAKGWPETDSDEGTMGLAAMHIALRGEHPVFLYGQNYMGMIEAYLGAFLFRLFGVSLFNLRLGMTLLFTLFLVSMYCLTSLLYSKKLALVTLALLSIGARYVLMPEIRAVGGAVETLLFGCIVMLLAAWLALTVEDDAMPRKRRRRLVAYGCWGLATGLGLWSHMLVLPFVLTSGLILLLFCRRELRSWAILCLIVGFVIGAMPLIYYNITVPLTQNSFAVALNIQNARATGIALTKVTFAKQLSGTLFFSLPEATGLNPLCTLEQLPLFGPATSRDVLCTVVQGGWSLGYIALMLVSALLALLPLWKLWQLRRSPGQQWSIEEQQAIILHAARFMLLCGAGFTLALFALSPLAAEKPWSTRYLIGLLIATPALLWPFWNGLRDLHLRDTALLAHWSQKFGVALRGSCILLIGLTFLAYTIYNFHEIPNDEKLLQQDITFTHDLLQHGIKHIYAGYWVCDRLIFASQEQIICKVVETNLSEGLNRYTAYAAIVAADPTSPYAFPVGSDFAMAATHNPLLNSSHYRRFVLDGYVIYQPMHTK